MDNVTTEIDYSAQSKRLGMVYGLLTGIAMVVFSLVLYFTHVSMNSWVNYLVLAIFFLGVIMFCLAYGRSQNHQVTFGMVFKAGFSMVAFTTLIMLAWAVLAIFIFPQMKEESLQATQEQLVKQKMPVGEINKTMAKTREKYTLLTGMVVMFSNLFYGVVFLLIGSGITRKNKAG